MTSSPSRSAPLRRLLMLAATFTVGAIGWILLDEPDAVGASESRDHVVARVDGVAVTQNEVHAAAADELRDLEARRSEILRQAADERIADLLIASEARRRGVDRTTLLATEVEAVVDAVVDGEQGEDRDVLRTRRLAAFVDELRSAHDVRVYGAGLEAQSVQAQK